MSDSSVTGGGRAGSPKARGPLSKREREVFGLLADGLSGAEIAERLVLSPETVRTHIRNAMGKLGASTRSHAVAIALRRGEIPGGPAVDEGATQAVSSRAEDGDGRRSPAGEELAAPLEILMEGLMRLWDVDAGWAYLTDADGLSLHRVAQSQGPETDETPAVLALGDGPIGGAALERRAQVVQAPGAETGAMVVAPMVDRGQLVGVLVLATRPSRPTGRQELLLLQALAGRVAELVRTGGPHVSAQIDKALRSFRASWTSASRPV